MKLTKQLNWPIYTDLRIFHLQQKAKTTKNHRRKTKIHGCDHPNEHIGIMVEWTDAEETKLYH